MTLLQVQPVNDAHPGTVPRITGAGLIPVSNENGSAVTWARPLDTAVPIVIFTDETEYAIAGAVDGGNRVCFTSNDPVEVTLPGPEDEDYPIGQTTIGVQYGLGTVSWVAPDGVELLTPLSANSYGQGATMSITRDSATQWTLAGFLATS